MTHPIIKTDNYILITSDEEIKEDCYAVHFSPLGEIELVTANGVCKLDKKIIAHLSLNNQPILEGVPLLPTLPNQEDNIEKLAELNGHPETSQFYDYREGFIDGFLEAKEKYKFTEEEVIKAIKMTRGSDIPIETIIQSISQPKLPAGFKCRMETSRVPYGDDGWKTVETGYKIINGVMQGEWIFE